MTEQEYINKINDLEKRLKIAYDSDAIIQNQELEGLKMDIKDDLKIAYNDFIIENQKEENVSTVLIYNACLKNIFRALKKNNINMED